MLRASAKRLEAKYGIRIPPEFEETGWSARILPYGRAPVVIRENGKRVLQMMQFSLLPAWSKEKRVKFATHNARLDGIADKPTWKRPFQERRCLVPITDFIEPIYSGDLAGNMVDFHRPDQDILTAAGLWDEWIDSKSGEIIRSFTIITHDPVDFVAKIGHDRSPLFIEDSDAAELDYWLDEQKRPATELKEFLLRRRIEPELRVEKDRPLKAGWEKRR